MSLRAKFWIVVGASAALPLVVSNVFAASTHLVSVRDRTLTPHGALGASRSTSVSADGRWMAFTSTARDLVPDDTNEHADIFLYDRETQAIRRISLAADGAEANADSADPKLSTNGRYITFSSNASNLVADDTNGSSDVFVYDRVTRTTERVSVQSTGAQAIGDSLQPAISGDGRFVVYSAKSPNLIPTGGSGWFDIYLFDRKRRITTLLTIDQDQNGANGDSVKPTISADGRWIAFASDATNQVSGDTNGRTDVYLVDRLSGQRTLASVNATGLQGNDQSFDPAITADGRYLTFASKATNLIGVDPTTTADIYLRDLQTGGVTLVSSGNPAGSDQNGFAPAISADARYIAYSGSASSSSLTPQIFLRDLATSTLSQITEGSGTMGSERGGRSASLSADGKTLAFASDGPALVEHDGNFQFDAFYYTVDEALITLVSSARAQSASPAGASYNLSQALSANGRYVAFNSDAELLVDGDANNQSDSFLRDRALRQTRRVSTTSTGEEVQNGSYSVVTSADGQTVVFTAADAGLDPLDDGCIHIYAKNMQSGQVDRVDVTSDELPGGGTTFFGCLSASPAVSADGRYVAFQSYRRFAGDGGVGFRVYMRDRVAGTTELVSIHTQDDLRDSDSPSISAHGRYVTFESNSSSILPEAVAETNDIFVYDRQTHVSRRLSESSPGIPGNEFSHDPVISADGRYVAFLSLASDLVPGDTNGVNDAFLYDLQASTLSRVSVSSSGTQANGESTGVSIDGDGGLVAFASKASNLVSADANGVSDIFLRDIASGVTTLQSVSTAGVQGNGASTNPSLSPKGNALAFTSSASNLVSRDLNGADDVFIRLLKE